MKAAFVQTKDDSTNCIKLPGSNKQHVNGSSSNSISFLISSDDSGLDTCSFLSAPSDAAIIAFCEGSETVGSVAYAPSGCGETAGSVASAGGFSGGSSCGSSPSCGGGGSFC